MQNGGAFYRLAALGHLLHQGRHALGGGDWQHVAAAFDHLPGMVKRYPQLTLPIGLIYGAKDQVLDFQKHGQALSSLVPGVKLQLVEGRGHMLPITATERVVAVVEQVAKRARSPQNTTVLHPPLALANK